MDVESGALQRVTDMGRAYRPFYSPDGTQFALLQYGTESDPTGDLTLVNADGTDRRVVLRFPAGPTTASSDSQIAWLPDGSGLWAYVPDPSTSSETDGTPAAGGPLNGATLYRVPATGGDVQSAGRVDGVQVFWSPDGSRLAYTRAGIDGALDLFLANADGANPQLYASLGNGGFVNWAPDGAHFIYTDDSRANICRRAGTERRNCWERASACLTHAGSLHANCWRCTTRGRTGCWSRARWTVMQSAFSPCPTKPPTTQQDRRAIHARTP